MLPQLRTLYEENLMRLCTACAIGILLFTHTMVTESADMVRAYILNEDSHPHQVPFGDSARFFLEPGKVVAWMDVKCSLEGDKGKPLTAVTLRTHGLIDVQWPFPTRTIRVDKKIDFDIIAQTQPAIDGLSYYEFVNEDQTRLLWHQCYNN
jgi:hypothetical protein